ncbi:MAG: 30S ribosomal protein S12 methylthiotransferase RimO [Helicobacteraceae bacterium]|nr:30S ribosomal protein S12 methylthiotransferase RimO [Helicobacteraceae bacterium]
MQKLHLISLGCTKNLVDSEIMLGRLKECEITQNLEEADLIIVNTCGFIEAAKTESIEAILSAAKRKKAGALLIVSGCLSERYREELIKELPEVDIFTGVGDYAKIDELILKKQSAFSDQVFLQSNEERVVTASAYHAYIKIAEGCNQRCSFCAIPSFKGKLRSRSLESVINEIVTLVRKGYFDFSLIAQDTSSYGRDIGLKNGLCDLIEKIDQIEGVKRARICYLYPATTSLKLIATIANSKRFAPYFDMPIQHVSDRMLKTMKRGLNAQKTFALIAKAREIKNVYIRTAFIIGHPYESEADFTALCEVIKTGVFDRVSLFAFSDEEGTTSNKMRGKVDSKTIQTRMKIAQKLLKSAHKKRLKKVIGSIVTVAIDGASEESEHLIAAKNLDWSPQIDPPILINESEIDDIKPTSIGRAQIIAATDSLLIAKLLDG